MKNLKINLLLFFVYPALSLDNSYEYFQPIKEVGHLDSGFYSKAVQNLPIVCVDIFLYDSKQKKYLVVKRDQEPLKGSYWFPGGRINKGESFFKAAKRKCKQELGVKVVPKFVLDVASTTFENSAWNVESHTVNVIVVAEIKNDPKINLDNLHSGFEWRDIEKDVQENYINDFRKKFLKLHFLDNVF